MAVIKVFAKINNSQGWVFNVKVRDKKGETSHRVTLVKYDYNNLTGGKIPANKLVRKSFEFLLKKESKAQILKEFNLMEINNYFSGYKEFVSGLLTK